MATPFWRRWVRGPELDAAEAYARWAPRYAPAAHNALMAIEQAAVTELLPVTPGPALDLGCGSGRYARLLRARCLQPVVALDQSLDMLQRAAEVTWPLVRADLRAIPFRAAAFDLVVCGLAVGDVPEIGAVVSEAARVLRQGGWLVYSDLHPRGARAGWRRTFEDESGRQYAVRHYIHELGDHLTACQSAGLAVEAVREPLIDFPHLFRGWPAALVIRARRAP